MKTLFTLLLAVAAGLPPVLAQTRVAPPTAVAAKIPDGPGPCDRIAVASPATLCPGGSAVLTVQGGCFDEGPATFSWSPDQDISALTGPRVVVNPLVTTTYTVVVSPTTGAAYTRSVTVNVQAANCCQYPGPSAGVVELAPSYQLSYNTQTGQVQGDPFQVRPPGTTFHVAGPSLTLRGIFGSSVERFIMPAGAVLLMDADARVIVADQARLETNGSTITAACNAMWDGLYVQGNSGLLDMHSVPLTLNADTGPDSRQGMHNRIMHSRNGIVLEAGGPEFQINYTQFLHNYASLDVDRTGLTSTQNGQINKITRCLFNSDPAQMKAPYAPNGGNFYYTDRHVRLAGNPAVNSPALFLIRNSFNNALFHVVAHRSTTPLEFRSCTFSNFLLAGIFYGNATNTPLTPVTASDVLIPLLLRSPFAPENSFNYRPYKPLPTTSQIAAAIASYAPFYGTAAIRARDIQVVASGIALAQPQPGDYAPGGLTAAVTPQVGIQASKLNVNSCSFQDLAFGIIHDLPAVGTGGIQSVTQNYFGGCGTGYLFTALRGSTNGSNAGMALLDCNTFARVTPLSVNTGVYNGIRVESNAFARIGDAGNPGLILKNLFERGEFIRGGNRMQPIANANPTPFIYNTFDNYWATDVRPFISGAVQLPLPRPSAAVGTYQPGVNGCGVVGGPGLPRTSANMPVAAAVPDAKAGLAQNSPNPATGSTSIDYQFASDTRSAVLLVRQALDGKVVKFVQLKASTHQYDLNLAGYPAGTYFYTLLVNDCPVGTRRLVVE